MKYVLLLLAILVLSCGNEERYLASDFRIFKGTQSWELAQAVKSNDVEAIKDEISQNRALLSFQESRYGMSVLHLAIIHQKTKATKALLDLGFNLALYDYDDGASAFLMVCGQLDEKIYFPFFKMLLEYGADVNQNLSDSENNIDRLDYSALMFAVSKGNKNIVEGLLQFGARINYRSIKNRNAFSVAVHTNHLQLAWFLLKEGAECDAKIYTRYDAFQNPSAVYVCEHLNHSKFLTRDEYYYQIKNFLRIRKCC